MFKPKILLFALFATVAMLAPADGVKYVFLLIGDGYGANHCQLTESFLGRKLVMSQMPVNVLTSTTNVEGKTTDSGASGTAIACGVKTYNRAIGMGPDKQPVESLATKLHKKGFKIGMISSSPLTDATPAAHYAHQENRSMRKEIGLELATSGISFAGGAGVHDPTTLDDLRQAGWDVITGDKVLDRVRPGVQTFVDKSPYTPWPGDAAPTGPTLAEYLVKAIEHLNQTEGFFIMLENGRIDYAGHGNDAAMVWREVQAFDEAVAVALAFQTQHPDETLVIVTADHETGGLQIENLIPKQVPLLGNQQSPLSDLSWALDVLAEKLEGLEPDVVRLQRKTSLSKALATKIGITFTAAESAGIMAFLDQVLDAKNPKDLLVKTVKDAAVMRDTRVGVRFTTGGHTSARVNTWVKGPGAETFREPLENSDLPHLMQAIILPELLDTEYQQTRAARLEASAGRTP